ncbi:Pup--protein ligase [Rothia sp. SD9660Na]|uniref:Pup--protein ligase n=1 Tax=Rothia sp. SD9660Na TaxID=3047030 RepID=UPI0024B96968|nr:Pup--protein ligase [Rothia sp. SD9660Na]WHS49506.1 Pup--protein ligase [Rothia sp. SD9660Na]
MERRIFGIETEFGIRYIPKGLGPLAPEEAARKLFKPVVDTWRSSNVFLPNGGRLYLDVGSHPEYATAETASVRDALIQDKAGEYLLNDLVNQAEDSLETEGYQGQIFLFKNNVDSAGNSFGSHENYMLERKVEFSRLVRSLIPFLITRQIVVGAGKVHPAGPPQWGGRPLGAEGQPSFSFSQRADYIWEGSSTATTRARPIINTRDEPHADASLYRRMHVINGDSNMSQATTLLKLGATDLVLRMLEDYYPLENFEIKDTATALRVISHDLTGTATFPLADGRREANALTLQRHYHSAACRYVEEKGAHHKDVPYILDLWGRVLDAVESGDTSRIDTEIDWAIKKKLLDTYIARGASGYDDPKIQQLDLAYHDIDPTRGVFGLLTRKGLVKNLVSHDEIAHATVHPPATRAALRGRFISAARKAGEPFTVDWVHLKLNNQPHLTVMCKDPFATESTAMDDLLATLNLGPGDTWSPPFI